MDYSPDPKQSFSGKGVPKQEFGNEGKPNYQDSTFAGVAVLRSAWCVIGGVAVGVVLVVGNDGPIHTRRMADGAETVTQQIPHLVRGVLGDDDSGQVEIFVPSLP